jgi:hypothetical protein
VPPFFRAVSALASDAIMAFRYAAAACSLQHQQTAQAIRVTIAFTWNGVRYAGWY